jgi:hypothetical protein
LDSSGVAVLDLRRTLEFIKYLVRLASHVFV